MYAFSNNPIQVISTASLKNRDWTIRRNRLQSGIKMGICCWRFYPKKVNPQLLKKFSFSWAFLTTQGWFIMSCKEGLSLALETRILEIRSAASGLTNSGIEYWNGNHNYFKISTIKHIQDIKVILHDNQDISCREPSSKFCLIIPYFSWYIFFPIA